MKVSVVIPTTGRAPVVAKVLEYLRRQRRPADEIIVVAVEPADVAGVEATPPLDIRFAPRGSCAQRNAALAELMPGADLAILLDDDFLPREDFIERAIDLFAEHKDIVGATGHVIADGVRCGGVEFDDATTLIDDDLRQSPSGAPVPPDRPIDALYGCNMVLRVAALEGMRFDENLPLYGWLEDIDFTYRLSARGRLVKSPLLRGVHLGVKSGRSPGKRLGYSQIANPIYLLRKKSIPPRLARRLMLRQGVSNLARSFYPEAHIDRRGRLYGNLIALKDLMVGKLDPARITEFK